MGSFSRLSVIILLVACIFRIFVMVWSLNLRENTDVLRYQDWVSIGYLYGFADTYKSDHLTFGTHPNNQPPGSVYILSVAYHLELYTAKILLRFSKNLQSNQLVMDWYLPDIFLRLPSMIADIILGSFIYLFIKNKRSEFNALLGLCLFLFTPPVWYNSAFWGQMDSVNNLFFFLAIYYLYEHKSWWSLIFCSLSMFTKVSLLPALPLFLTLVFYELGKKKKQFLFMIFVCLFCMILFSMPISGFNFLWLFTFYKNNSLGEMHHITNFAFNLWWMLIKPTITIGKLNSLNTFSHIEMHNITPDNYKLGFFPLYIWAAFLYTCMYIPIVMFLFTIRKKISVKNGVLGLSLIMVISFLVLPMMHERYLYPIFPLLATYVGLERKNIFIFLFLSLFNSINLYVVWHPMMLWILPYQIFSNRVFQWLISFGVVITSLYMYVSSLVIFQKYEE